MRKYFQELDRKLLDLRKNRAVQKSMIAEYIKSLDITEAEIERTKEQLVALKKEWQQT